MISIFKKFKNSEIKFKLHPGENPHNLILLDFLKENSESPIFQTKNILLKFNLDWEDEIRNYEKTHRVVKTASFNQVRDKIKKNTSKQWEKYSDYLKPMQNILKDNQIKF